MTITSPKQYQVQQISNAEANKLMREFHYLHRSAPASYSYGLLHNNTLIGAIIYGPPANQHLRKGVCGPEETEHVYELTRLWITDNTPKNTESYLIGKSLKMLPPNVQIIVSYAEIGAGHRGTVYQATNFYYTGKSDRHIDWTVTGIDSKLHNRHLFDQYGGIKGAKAHFGDRMVAHERPRKHRYVYINAKRRRRQELIEKLKYQIQTYPTQATA